MKIIITFLAICLVVVNCAYAEEAPTESHLNFGPAPQSVVDAFSDALNDNKSISILNPFDQPLTGEQGLVWAGSRLETKASAKTSIVTFKNRDSGNTFGIEVEFSRTILKLKVPKALDARFRTTYFLKLSPVSLASEYVAGQGDTGFVLLTPKTQNSDWYGFIVCPRRLEVDATDKFNQKERAVVTNYEPYGMSTTVTGEARGKYRSGTTPAHAIASILTSPDVLPADRPVESVEDRDPEVEASYRPDHTQDSTLVKSGVFASGIQTKVVLKSPASQTRERISESIIRVERIALKKSFTFQNLNRETIVAPGACFAIIKHSSTSESIP